MTFSVIVITCVFTLFMAMLLIFAHRLVFECDAKDNGVLCAHRKGVEWFVSTDECRTFEIFRKKPFAVRLRLRNGSVIGFFLRDPEGLDVVQRHLSGRVELHILNSSLRMRLAIKLLLIALMHAAALSLFFYISGDAYQRRYAMLTAFTGVWCWSSLTLNPVLNSFSALWTLRRRDILGLIGVSWLLFIATWI